jgi:hypothetical protein
MARSVSETPLISAIAGGRFLNGFVLLLGRHDYLLELV